MEHNIVADMKTTIETAVQELWSADRDFERFPGLTVRSPLVG